MGPGQYEDPSILEAPQFSPVAPVLATPVHARWRSSLFWGCPVINSPMLPRAQVLKEICVRVELAVEHLGNIIEMVDRAIKNAS